MQALRHASRRALRVAEVMQEPCIAYTRACSSEAGPRTTVRLSKEERHQLASQFVEKFKAANNGQLPKLNLLRKEVGGSYDILKEVIQEFEKGPREQVASEETSDLKKSKTPKAAVKQDQQGVKGATQEFSAVAKDGGKKKSSSKAKKGAATMQDQHDEEEVTVTKDSSESVKDGREKQKGAVTMQDQRDEEEMTKDPSQSAKDGWKKQKGAVTMQDQHGEEEVTKDSSESVKDGRKKQFVSEKAKDIVKDKKSTPDLSKILAETKLVKQADAKLTFDYTEKQKQVSVAAENTLNSLAVTFDTDEDDDDDSDVAAPEYPSIMQMKEGLPQANEDVAKVASVVRSRDDQPIKAKLQPKEEDSKREVIQKGLAIKSLIQSMPKPPTTQLPPTTVLRIINLPAHISTHQLRSLCESIARVHGVRLRRGRIADVQFDVEIREMNDVLERLRRVPIGNSTLRVFPALRFSCESNVSGRLKPREVHQFKHVRNGLINAFEQRFKFLCFQVQDFRELHNLKVAK